MRVQGLSSRDIIGRFYQRLKEMGAGWMDDIGFRQDSDQESETYKWLGMSPQMREWLGARQAKSLSGGGVTIANKIFEATLNIDVDDLRRDKTGQIQVRINELARRTQAHWRKLGSALIEDGEAGATYLAHDGQPLFSAAHRYQSNDDAGVQTNLVTASEVPKLDVTIAAPTQYEIAQAVLGCVSHMRTLLDDTGEPVNEEASAFTVMVNKTLYPIFKPALTQANIQTTAGALVPNPASGDMTIKVVMNPRLGSGWDDNFAMFQTDSDVKAIILQEELAPQMQAIAEGSELEINENIHRYGVKAVRNVGVGAWWTALKATLS